MSVYLSILKQWIIDPIQNSIVLPLWNLLPDPIKKCVILPITVSIWNEFGDRFLKHLIDRSYKFIFDQLLNFVFNLIISLFNLLKRVFVAIKPHICYPFKKLTEKLKEKRDSFLKHLIDRSYKFIFDQLLNFKRIFVAIKPRICYPFKKLTEKLKEKRDSLEQSVSEAYRVTNRLSSANNEINDAELRRKETARSIPFVYPEAFRARVVILKQVMHALKDPKLYTIRVYGLGRLENTTLAKEVQRKAVEEKMFERVVMVPVSQTPDLGMIQEEIAGIVDLRFDAHGVAGRASQLKERLQKSKVLIILDDIGTEFEPSAVGIPLKDECKGSKLLLTSRSHVVLSREMGKPKEFSLEVLSEEETWKLFKKTLKNANNPELQAVAMQIANKCSGMPHLVNKAAAHLKNKKQVSEWLNYYHWICNASRRWLGSL